MNENQKSIRQLVDKSQNLKIDILTLFPNMFIGPFGESIVKRAQDKNLVEITIHDLRNWTDDKRQTVDDKPYGGGIGMVMMIEPIDKALNELRTENKEQRTKTILLSPRGKVFNQEMAKEFSQLDRLIMICGHYEGIDERVTEYLIDEEVSVGDYVLTGGEIPAMIITDTVTRLIPNVLEKSDATEFESFSNLPSPNPLPLSPILLEYPQYTRPETYNNWSVPEVLLSGDHKKIANWRQQKSLEKTKKIRPDLLNDK